MLPMLSRYRKSMPSLNELALQSHIQGYPLKVDASTTA